MTEENYSHTIQHLLFQSDAKVYAVLDGASVKGLLDKFYKLKPNYICLYRGELAPDLAQTAPYLVQLDLKNKFTHWIIDSGWGEHWGVFAESKAKIETLRKHFRKFLMVYDENNNSLYFRFYDPRVFRAYLPTCNEEEARQIFGPVISYAFEGESKQDFIRHWSTQGLPRKEEINLSKAL